MDIKLNLGHVPGGIFSKFMQMLPNAVGYPVERIYFDAYDERIDGNPFDWVFDQNCDYTFVNIDCVNKGSYTKDDCEQLGRIEASSNFEEMKAICRKINFTSRIFNLATQNKEFIDGFGVLGVHVRLGDMNARHPQFGQATTNDYIEAIKQINPQMVFIASDNHQSVKDIDNGISQLCLYGQNMIREDNDDFKESTLQLNNLNNPIFWEEAFLDMLRLSYCDNLLCRVSNLSNAAILFSDTIKTITRI